jgi:hypothetical protein
LLFLRLILTCVFLVILFIILYHILDRYSWEANLRSCEQLRQINNYGEELKVLNDSSFKETKMLGYKKRFYNSWFYPIIEDIEYSAEYIFFHKRTNLFNKQNVNLLLKQRKYFEIPILFKNHRQGQILLANKGYKLIHKNFQEKIIYVPLHPFSNILFIDPYFLSDAWSEVFPRFRGVKSCAKFQ